MEKERQMTLYEFGLRINGQASLFDFGLILDAEE
jgi:hypothetical protein